jgi:hypothetical protein
MAGQDRHISARTAGAESHEFIRLRVENQQLRIELTQALQAMAAREVIEQAKGLLMGHYRCESAQAFAMLRELSQRSNTKLRQVAVSVVELASQEGRVHFPGLTAVAEALLVGGGAPSGGNQPEEGPAGWH